MTILQKLKTFCISGLKLIAKLCSFYLGWIIRGFNFNPVLGDFFAYLQKVWGNSNWYSHRSALHVNYNAYIHKVGFILYLPLLWDICKGVMAVLPKFKEPAKKPKSKSRRFAKALNADAQKAPGSESEEVQASNPASAASSEHSDVLSPLEAGPSHLLRRFRIQRKKETDTGGILATLVPIEDSNKHKPN